MSSLKKFVFNPFVQVLIGLFCGCVAVVCCGFFWGGSCLALLLSCFYSLYSNPLLDV